MGDTSDDDASDVVGLQVAHGVDNGETVPVVLRRVKVFQKTYMVEFEVGTERRKSIVVRTKQ